MGRSYYQMQADHRNAARLVELARSLETKIGRIETWATKSVDPDTLELTEYARRDGIASLYNALVSLNLEVTELTMLVPLLAKQIEVEGL